MTKDSTRSVAVILAVHNRRDTTVTGPRSLWAQSVVMNGTVDVSVWLTDDGSTDGTADAIAGDPRLHILKGDGTLYWVGGMAMAHRAARETNPDIILWMNDDVILDADALELGLATYDQLTQEHGRAPIVVGPMRGHNGRITYSGIEREGTGGFDFHMVVPDGTHPAPAQSICGNFVLVPPAAMEEVDPFDGTWIHRWMDFDFGFRCAEHGYPIYTTPRAIGRCDLSRPAWRNPDATIAQGLKSLWRQRNSRMLTSAVRFYSRHAGPHWRRALLKAYYRKFRSRAVLRNAKRTRTAATS